MLKAMFVALLQNPIHFEDPVTKLGATVVPLSHDRGYRSQTDERERRRQISMDPVRRACSRIGEADKDIADSKGSLVGDFRAPQGPPMIRSDSYLTRIVAASVDLCILAVLPAIVSWSEMSTSIQFTSDFVRNLVFGDCASAGHWRRYLGVIQGGHIVTNNCTQRPSNVDFPPRRSLQPIFLSLGPGHEERPLPTARPHGPLSTSENSFRIVAYQFWNHQADKMVW